MSTKKLLREVRRIARANDLSCKEVSQNKHIKLAITRADQTTSTLTLAVSAGDRRTINNVDAMLRRFAAGGDL